MGTVSKNVESMLLSFSDWNHTFGKIQENKTKVYVVLEKAKGITLK